MLVVSVCPRGLDRRFPDVFSTAAVAEINGQAQAKADQLQLKASKIEARFRLNRLGVTSAQVQSAKVAGQVAALKAQALSGSYLGLSQNGGAPTLDVLIDPTSASSSNRKSNIEKYAVIGAVAGLAIGIAFAVLISALGTRSLARRTSA